MFGTTTQFLCAALAALVLCPCGGHAQGQGKSHRLSLGAYTVAAPGIKIGPNGEEPFRTNAGPGIGMSLGYAFRPNFVGYTSLDLTRQGSGVEGMRGTFGLVHLEIGTKFFFQARDETMRPYASVSFGRRAVGARITADEFEGSTTFSFQGDMLSAGAGLEKAISPTLSWDAGLTLAYGRFGDAELGGQHAPVDVSSTTSVRMRVGVTWRP